MQVVKLGLGFDLVLFLIEFTLYGTILSITLNLYLNFKVKKKNGEHRSMLRKANSWNIKYTISGKLLVNNLINSVNFY